MVVRSLEGGNGVGENACCIISTHSLVVNTVLAQIPLVAAVTSVQCRTIIHGHGRKREGQVVGFICFILKRNLARGGLNAPFSSRWVGSHVDEWSLVPRCD